MATASLYANEATDLEVADLEVRIYDHDHLLGRECCAAEQDVNEIVGRWSAEATLIVVADHIPHSPGPSPVRLAAAPTTADEDEARPLAQALLPGYGTE